ncbi:hypothetical protein [Polaribacter sp.]|uniref:hypothetical protein n=1 Tax=Polaribacter sp. TaxID=1920175 RepID=UPI003EF9BC77
MKKLLLLLCISLQISCQDFGQLKVLADLPKKLDEVSGVEKDKNSEILWMLNDSGNSPKLYGVNLKGQIEKEIYIQTKNHDWEDLTSDEKGNVYIGDFGNNQSKRKNLVILKITPAELQKKNAEVLKIKFTYPNQTKYPPKKKQLYFDCEAVFYHQNYLYLFTKSRVKNKYGKTSLYKIPAKEGTYVAEFIGEYDNGDSNKSWITSADISSDGNTVILLSQKNIVFFSDFKEDDFFSGKVEKIELKHFSQKEGITFKDDKTLLITDEKAHGIGGFLYELNYNSSSFK